jgi:interferon, gamma-inducible protein 30
MRLIHLHVFVWLSLSAILSAAQQEEVVGDQQQQEDLTSVIHAEERDPTLAAASSPTSPPPKVKVMASIESLCSGCKAFMNDQLFPVFQLLGSQVLELDVVVFGNSAIDLQGKTVNCQHGAAECDANTYEQCAVDLYKYPDRYLAYLHCLDNELTMGRRDEPFDAPVFAGCARDSALDFGAIKACHDDAAYAWALQKRAAESTPDDHTYVPWVLINGEHTIDEDNDSLLEAVCKAYQSGGGKHPACPTGNGTD